MTMPSQYIRHIRSNIKGGVDEPLGRLTLLVGPNGAGKDRILQSVQLAARGRASDILGKDGSSWALLSPLLTAGQSTLEAEAELFPAGKAVFHCAPGKKPHQQGPVVLWPLASMVEVLSEGSIDSQRKVILGALGKDGARLQTEMASVKEQLLATTKALADARIKLSALDAVTPAVGNLQEMEQRCAYLQDQLQNTPETPNVAYMSNELARLDREIGGLRAEYSQANGVVAQLENRISELHQQINALPTLPADVENWRLVQRILAQMDAGGSFAAPSCECPTCGRGDFSGGAERLGRLNAYLNQVGSVGQQRDALAAQLQQANAQKDHATANLARIRALGNERVAQFEMLQGNLQRAQAAQGQMEGLDANLLRDEIRRLQEKIGAVKHGDSVRQQRTSLTTQVSAGESSQNSLNSRLADLEAQSSRLLQNCTAQLRSNAAVFIESALPRGGKFDIRFENDSLVFGIVRDGVLHRALSGAEWNIVVMGLAAALAPDGFNLFIPQERVLGQDILTRWMRALQLVPGQVILSTVTAPDEKVPGWTYVDLTAGQPAMLAAPAVEVPPPQDPSESLDEWRNQVEEMTVSAAPVSDAPVPEEGKPKRQRRTKKAKTEEPAPVGSSALEVDVPEVSVVAEEKPSHKPKASAAPELPSRAPDWEGPIAGAFESITRGGPVTRYPDATGTTMIVGDALIMRIENRETGAYAKRWTLSN